MSPMDPCSVVPRRLLMNPITPMNPLLQSSLTSWARRWCHSPLYESYESLASLAAQLLDVFLGEAMVPLASLSQALTHPL